jgi:hypothetical protein
VPVSLGEAVAAGIGFAKAEPELVIVNSMTLRRWLGAVLQTLHRTPLTSMNIPQMASLRTHLAQRPPEAVHGATRRRESLLPERVEPCFVSWPNDREGVAQT